MSTYDIAIVIPCFNAARYLRDTIESVLMQKGVSSQVICVDNGSTDETLEIITSFGTRVHLAHCNKRGANSARNVGLSVADALFVKFLDSDDLLHCGSLHKQFALARELNTRGRGVSVYGKAKVIDENNLEIGDYPIRSLLDNEDILAFILDASPITSCPLHSTADVRAVGGFTEDIPTQHEHDLHFRLAMNGVSFVFHNDFVYSYRQHDSQSRITNDPFAGGEARFCVDYYLIRYQDLIDRFGTNGVPSECRQVLAQQLWKAGRWCARHSEKDAANECFEHAKLIAFQNACFGRLPYRMIVLLLGPYIAERFFLFFRA